MLETPRFLVGGQAAASRHHQSGNDSDQHKDEQCEGGIAQESHSDLPPPWRATYTPAAVPIRLGQSGGVTLPPPPPPCAASRAAMSTPMSLEPGAAPSNGVDPLRLKSPLSTSFP